MKIRYLCYSLLAISLICPKQSKPNKAIPVRPTPETQVPKQSESPAPLTSLAVLRDEYNKKIKDYEQLLAILAASRHEYNTNEESYNERRASLNDEHAACVLNPLYISNKKIEQLISNIKSKNNELSQLEKRQDILNSAEKEVKEKEVKGHDLKPAKKKDLDSVNQQINMLKGNITALENELDEEKKSFDQTEYDTYTRNLAKKETDLRIFNETNKSNLEKSKQSSKTSIRKIKKIMKV